MSERDKEIFLQRINGNKALAHLMIAELALISSPGIDIVPLYSNGTIDKSYRMFIPQLLRNLKDFVINEFDQSSHYRFPLESAADVLEGSQRTEIIQLLFNTALSVPIVRVFELLKSYCGKTNQMNKFRDQEWYLVARIIRNCFSHDFTLWIDPKDKNTIKKLPFTWKDIKITKEMLNKPLKYPTSSIKNLTSLFDTMSKFANQLD